MMGVFGVRAGTAAPAKAWACWQIAVKADNCEEFGAGCEWKNQRL